MIVTVGFCGCCLHKPMTESKWNENRMYCRVFWNNNSVECWEEILAMSALKQQVEPFILTVGEVKLGRDKYLKISIIRVIISNT